MKEIIAIRLKELNFPITKNVTIPFIFDERASIDRLSSVFEIMDGKYTEEDVLPAPSFEELWKYLPKVIKHPKYKTEEVCLTLNDGIIYYNQYNNYEEDYQFYEQYNDDITEAAAQLWITLKEKQLI